MQVAIIQSIEGLNRIKRWKKGEPTLSAKAKTSIFSCPRTMALLALGLSDSDRDLNHHPSPLPHHFQTLGFRLNYTTGFLGYSADHETSPFFVISLITLKKFNPNPSYLKRPILCARQPRVTSGCYNWTVHV